MSSYRGNSSPPPLPSLPLQQSKDFPLTYEIYFRRYCGYGMCIFSKAAMCCCWWGCLYSRCTRNNSWASMMALMSPCSWQNKPRASLIATNCSKYLFPSTPPPKNQRITPIVIDHVWNDGGRRGYGRDHRAVAAEVLVCEKGRTWAGRLSRYPIRVMPSLPYSVSTFLYLVLPPLSFSSSKWSYFISVTRPQLQQIFVTLQFAKPEDPLFEQSFINVMAFSN